MPSGLDVDIEGNAGDWRTAFVARIAENSPPHQKEEIVRQVSVVEVDPEVLVSFATPSSAALALNIAERAANAATNLRRKIEYRELQATGAKAFGVADASLPLLFDFLEHSMVTVAFSYQAIEVFANHVIAREITQPMEVVRRNRKEKLTPEEMERHLSTGEKLCQVLPVVRSMKSPKGSALWERFRKLEVARDSTVHLKVKDQYAKNKEALFFQMLNAKIVEFPSIASDVIRYYFKTETEPRWLLRFLANRVVDTSE